MGDYKNSKSSKRGMLNRALAFTMSASMVTSTFFSGIGTSVSFAESEESDVTLNASVGSSDDLEVVTEETEVTDETETTETSETTDDTTDSGESTDVSNEGSDSEEATTEKTTDDSTDSDSSESNSVSSEDATDESAAGSSEETDASSDASNDASSEASDESASNDASTEASSEEEIEIDSEELSSDGVVIDQGEDGYENFTEDTVIADFKFGSDNGITSETVYSEETGYGFSDVDYNTEADGWVNNVYYPRVANVTSGSATNVADESDYVSVASKVWTETESTGYGVYTYENTSTFDVDLYNADYEVEVTLNNPTDSDYTAYLEAEDITQASNIVVSAGGSQTVNYEANLIDGQLNMKFLVGSSATTIDDASEQKVYVSEVKITRLQTQEAGSKPTVFVASDSTVQTYDSYYYPQTGWGQVFSEWFGAAVEEREETDCDYSQSQVYETENVIVSNRSIGGRSSSSFIAEGKLEDLLEDVKQGDYLFVQWGHNDATYSRPNRYVSSSDFGKYIMQYVEAAYQRGATPILVTPVARYSYSTDSDGNVTWNSNFEAYRQVMIQLAEEYDIPLIDLTARSCDICESFGAEGAKALFLTGVQAGDYTEGAYTGGSSDCTHLQWYGAYKFSQAVAQGILDYAAQTANEYALKFNDQLDSLANLVVMNAATEAPAQATNLQSTSVGSTSVSLSWDAADGSEMYYIFRQALEDGQTVDDVDFSSATKYSVTTKTSYTDSSCESGVTYAYAVAGWNSFGQGEISDVITVTTKEAGLKFDFNYNDSATMEGWTGVNQNQAYDSELGYGWITAPNNGRDRSGNGNDDSSAMADDFNLGTGEFAVDLPNGSYEVTIYACDLLPGTSTIKVSYTAEGTSFGSIACKQALGSCTGTVDVTDGQLNIVVGGTNNYINGMTITSLLTAPSNLAITELSFDGTKASFLLSFGTVDDAVSYTVYQKSESDTDYSVAKTFTAQELVDSELDCRAMTADLGETYSYYMTCTNSEGTESPASNVVTQEMLDSSVELPAAPTNLVCTSPDETATELQDHVSLSWDANDSTEGVIKYIVYRSQKAEDDKAFKEFTKIGEATTTSYTDDTVKTNIHYYYKVAASNAAGIGEMSEVCITPAVGSLVAGGLESYASRALVAINLSGDAGAETKVTATDSDGNEITSGVYLSWRAFEGDLNADNSVNTTFTVYRNDTPIAEGINVTNCVDEGGSASDTYKVVGSNDAALGLSSVSTAVWNNQYQEFQLSKPEDQTMPDGSTCTYTANDMSVGDLDGDGELELIVKWYPSNAQDNSKSGYTGTTIIDGYDINFATGDASLMWRIDLGVNIRSGAHYTQFQVWDYDADGKAEIAIKTADGTTTYNANLEEQGYVGECSMASLDTATVSTENDYRNSSGYVLDGPEYFSMFNGEDGKLIDTTEYLPERGSVSAWGDSYGNRVDRFLSGTAYLNGETPFAVFCRGYYTRTCLTAYYLSTLDDGTQEIKVYWQFDTNKAGSEYEGQGNHALSVNDVDNDGCDEIIYGSLTIDNDGSVLYSTGLGHGDAEHVGDWIPSRDGLEIMDVHEHDDAAYHVEIHDAETGEILTGYYTGKDTGRGMAADIDPRYEGAEYWSIANPAYTGDDEPAWNTRDANVFSSLSGIYDSSDPTGNEMITVNEGATPASNFSIYWDGDLLAESQDHTFDTSAYVPLTTTIEKWDYENGQNVNLFESSEVYTSNGTKGNLGLVADIMGDWREEIIARCASDNSKIRVYSTTIQTDYVIPCLLTDLAYREGVAWQNVGYNQPAHTSYLISEGLLTAQLTEGEISYNSAEIQFSAANDGTAYGHDVTGYAIARATVDSEGNVGEYEVIDEIAKEDLTAVTETSEETEDTEDTTVTAPVDYKFDFGAGNTQDGWTAVSASTAYSSEVGYGFTDVTNISDKKYSELDDSLSDMYYDSALAWITNGTSEFKVDLPNGTYEVTQYIYNGSGAAYQKLTAEDVEFTDFRHGKSDITTSSETKTVEVTDGQLNLVNTVTKTGYAAMFYTGFEIKTANYDEALAAYEAAQNTTTETTATENSLYSYVDTTVSGNTTYSYKVAAIVDGKISHYSLPVEVLTTVQIGSVTEDSLTAIQNQELVEDTVLSDGQTVADLLKANVGTAVVKDSEGNDQTVTVSYTADDVDITTVGTYTAYAYVRGYAENPITVTVTVIANKATGYATLDDIEVIVGHDVTLPTTVKATFLNGTSEEVAVTWNTEELDTNTVGTYTLKATVEGDEEADVTQVVNVVADYIVAAEDVYVEMDKNTDVKDALPETANVTYQSGETGTAAVDWNVSEVDASTVGTYTATGIIDGFDTAVVGTVSVVLPALYKFDFGIKASTCADGWTTVTVNPKGGETPLTDLGSAYTADQGWGFSDGTQLTQGRQESFTKEGTLPAAVYTDFALPAGQEFWVDIENGTYQVEILSNSVYKSNVKGAVEGTSYNVSNTAGSYTWQVLENIVVEDGQMTFTFDSSTTSRMGAIVIRKAEETTEVQPGSGSSDDATTETSDDATTETSTDTTIEDEETPKADTTDKTQTVDTTETQETIAVTGVKISKSKKTMRVGQTYQISTTITPSNATNQEVTYKTSNKKVCKVDANGVVTAKKVGTAKITVTTKDGSKTATIKITVKKAIKVTKVKLNKTKKTIKLGKTYQLKATVKPTNATNKSVTWKSSNSKIATVDSNGKVTALKKGTVTITVKTKDGKYTAKCKIKVK